MRRFAEGASIVWRSVDVAAGRVQTVWPWTVVRDKRDGIVLHMPAGTVGKQRTGERGGPRDRMMLRWDGGHRDVTWHSTSVVRLYREGDDYSIWIARDATSGNVVWRYINLEDPWRRTAIGFDSKDRWLDLAAEPGGEWRWKDEDEVDWLVAEGRITREYASAIRASGERALESIRRGETLLAASWDTWRPDPAWRTPTVPDDWREYLP